jgi:hypothetical protein
MHGWPKQVRRALAAAGMLVCTLPWLGASESQQANSSELIAVNPSLLPSQAQVQSWIDQRIRSDPPIRPDPAGKNSWRCSTPS